MIPDLNKRIKYIIDNQYNGNVKKFSEKINISQQKINRLFLVDNRTNKYPSVPSDVIINICKTFKEINCEWLLIGNGEIFKDNFSSDGNIEKNNISSPKLKNEESYISSIEENTKELKSLKKMLNILLSESLLNKLIEKNNKLKTEKSEDVM